MALSSPISTAIGKYGWLVAGIMLLVSIALGVWVFILYLRIDVYKEKISTREAQLDAVEKLVESNRIDYEERLKKLPYQIKEIETKYYPVVREITKWKEEANASDCHGSMRFVNTFAF